MGSRSMEGAPVLLFDGACGLCNAVVRMLLRIDRRGQLWFSALQSPFGQSRLRILGLDTTDFDSLVFLPDAAHPERGHLLRTDAVAEILRRLGGVWSVLAWLQVLPRPLRDGFYRLVARSRYLLFGRYRPRPLARSEWAGRFINEVTPPH